MYLALLKIFFLLNIFILSEVTGKDSHPYNIQNAYQRFYTTVNTKDKSPHLAKYIFKNPVDLDSVLEELKSLSETSKCSQDIVYTFESLKNTSNQWALSMLDAFGKPESGILQGNFFWVGEYNECINVYAPAKVPGSATGNFHGQYCSLAYNLPLLNTSFPLKFGLCLPDSCSPQDLQNKKLQLLHEAGGFNVPDKKLFLEKAQVTCIPKGHQLTGAAISVIVLISIFCMFALVGSSITAGKYFKKVLKEKKSSTLVINVYDDISNQEGIVSKCRESDEASLINNDECNNKGFSGSLETFLNCFCIFTNGAKLLNTDSSEGQLLCIHGIRFLSMSWVILGHAYMFNVAELRNAGAAVSVLNDFPFQIVLQGFYSVDSFFVLSGFLLSYLSMKEFSKSKGSINWLYFYIHRYIRLTPIYMIVLGFSAAVFYYVGSGPYWPVGDYDPNCRKIWWWNVLYINNFADQADQCMGWAWYLANDMQFFVISPIFLISLWKWPKIGYSLLGIFLLACMLSNFFITYHFDLMVGLVGIGGIALKKTNAAQNMLKFKGYFDKIYTKPYTRIGPYLVGMIAGYILFKHKTNNRPKLSWINLCIGWIVASVVTLTCVYGLYHRQPSLVARSIYNAVNRICFGSGLSWVIYVCLTNQSDIVNRILSYKLFMPLSRLTYSAYLIHPLILTGYYANMKKPMEFAHPTIVLLFLGFMVTTYALALPVSLILESPIVSMEKMIRSKFTKKKTESAS